MAEVGGDALWVELYAVNRIARVLHGHDEAIVRVRGGDKAVRERFRLDDKRVIARRLELRRQTGEKSDTLVMDGGELTVHHLRRADDAAAVSLADGLMPETHAEQRHAHLAVRSHKIEADARLIRVARARRHDDGLRAVRQRFGYRDLVIAHDAALRPQFAEIMHEIVGKAVVIIDKQDHNGASLKQAAVLRQRPEIASASLFARLDALRQYLLYLQLMAI